MVRLRFKQFKLISVLLCCALLLAGCGGSSSSSSSSPDSSNITGFVADGYLSGATVFLDCNDNRVLDTDEISATTDATGQYIIDTSGATGVDDCPVVAEVTETTVDLDTDMPVQNAYTLVSPPGYTSFVSPLTTMIQVNYESNPGITVDEAHDAVRNLLAVDDQSSVSLFEDYIDNSTAGAADAEIYDDLHKFAQLSARILGDNLDQLQQAAQDQNYTISDDVKDDLLRLTMKEIMQNADAITEVINSSDPAEGDDPFNPDADAQAIDITIDTSDVSQVVQQEQTVFDNQVPSLKWAGIFRANWSIDGAADIFALGLENDLDPTGYEFSVDGPGGFTYTFVEADFDLNDPSSPVAMFKVYNAPDYPAEGEYIFYITPPGGTRTEVARDTHVHKTMPIMHPSNVFVMSDANGEARIYHDKLPGTYYYRIVIRDAATQDFVYRGKRQSFSVQKFPLQYATADYQYRIEAWDAPSFHDAVARSQTGWQDFGSVAGISANGAMPSYYGAYWRQAYAVDGITLNNSRKVLDIAIINHDDLTELTLTSDRGYSFTMPVAAEVRYVDNDPEYWLEKKSHIFGGVTVVHYYLQIKNPDVEVETFTWTATTTSGGDFAISSTIYPKVPLPCIDPATVTMSEDVNGMLTLSWDAVTASQAGQDNDQQISYRIRILNGENNDLDQIYRSKRMPKTTLYIPRSDIEDVIGADFTDAGTQYRIEVYDSTSVLSINNWTQIGYKPVVLD